ncbi:glycosyltransferase [Robertkochia sediminum]|uniref:glycosyltransferase n=1 Tax=Robertkochia sediminum TaxID=2785326 RepID=UPI001931A18D|nr:glycosyltransferase [Robertkochia sediminum]MBL7472771.1 glycosyltransferase [Robertkochia sediminum]
MSKTKPVHKPTQKERKTLRIMIILGVISLLNFFFWFISFDYIGNRFLYMLLLITIGYTSLRILYEWYHYWNISVPEKKTTRQEYTVDFLTTYFPGEPYDMIENTLIAIKNIRYPHTTILCDEADDERLKAFCKKHGIIHISRDNRINAKAGNINNALNKVAKGEICVILDPDHVPDPEFLDEVIPYFDDEEIGYVQVVQAYKNFDESYVAKGAAQQTFQFYGPMMMCMNSYGTVNAIGANCTFRRAALDSIGGHAPGLAEDMHTAMLLHAKGWKSIYVPKVLARGLVPASMTAYYKQQLKWSRGTLELLVSVYPKIFKNLTWRQRLHYATIPLHYLIGFTFLINFLIPIISLTTATSPWTGNIVFFGLITIPLITSLLVIRSFVQRWVMEESERGFHMVGGLLLINTWWVFCLGAFYTLLRKKVPYLPTPKTGDDKTSWKLLIPNMVIALVSLFAIFYGLSKDFSPFSIFMSGFALLNIAFMLFSLYLADHKYVDIESLTDEGKKRFYTSKLWIKQKLWDFRHDLYRGMRGAALPLVVMSFLVSFALISYDQYLKWEGVRSYPELPVLPNKYLGIYAPHITNGVSFPRKARETESALSTRFDIMSHYIPWGDTGQEKDFKTVLSLSNSENYIPFITWEPWCSTFDISAASSDLSQEKKVFSHISKGEFDPYLKDIAEQLKAFNKPVYLRFAHEFDNPQYPWSEVGNNTPSEFKKAWIYIHNYFENNGVTNVEWVWNPWKARAIASYYPGDQFVDYVGVTALNYGNLTPSGEPYDFNDIYYPIKEALKENRINKPVFLAEFGSLNIQNIQTNWINDALDSIYENHPEIAGILFFNSDIDKNVPVDEQSITTLDWSLKEVKPIRHKLWEMELETPDDSISYLSDLALKTEKGFNGNRLPLPDSIRGVSYKKGQNWFKNYQVMDIRTVSKDFDQMKTLSLNTVKYFGNPVYDRNMLSAARSNNMAIIYGLWMPASLGQNRDDENHVEKTILASVRKLKGEQEIIAWNLGNDIITRINQLNKEENARMKILEHISWLKNMLRKIKEIDPNRPVILDLDLNRYASKNALLLLAELEDVDALAITIRNKTNSETFLEFARLSKIPVLIGDASPEVLSTLTSIPEHYFLSNWQDQHESNHVSFDGLLDHKGRTKRSYALARDLITDNFTEIPADKVRILRPAVPLRKGRAHEYHALIASDNTSSWDYATPDKRDQLEWTLVKCDRFGTPLAFKDLGTGLKKQIEIPENFENYFLVLKYIENDVVHASRSSLNLPDRSIEPALFAQYGL